MNQTSERSLQQEALDTLAFIADAMSYQADIVRFAVGVGIPKRQVHQLTGLARTTIDRMTSDSPKYGHPCDYCLQAHFHQLRRGEPVEPIETSSGYLIYRIGDRLEIVAQKLCERHRAEQWAAFPKAARYTWVPHLPNTPSRIVYSLGGVRDDTDSFKEYFSRFPEWSAKIEPILGAVLRPAGGRSHGTARQTAG